MDGNIFRIVPKLIFSDQLNKNFHASVKWMDFFFKFENKNVFTSFIWLNQFEIILFSNYFQKFVDWEWWGSISKFR